MKSPRNAEELFDPDGETPQPEDAVLDAPVKSNDPKQLKEKALRDKSRELQQENDLRAVLATQEGIRFVARILHELCGYSAPYFSQSYGEMASIAGKRQVASNPKGGLIEWVKNCDLPLWFKVEVELEKVRPKPKKPG